MKIEDEVRKDLITAIEDAIGYCDSDDLRLSVDSSGLDNAKRNYEALLELVKSEYFEIKVKQNIYWLWFWGFDQTNLKKHFKPKKFTDFHKMKEHSGQHSRSYKEDPGYWSTYVKVSYDNPEEELNKFYNKKMKTPSSYLLSGYENLVMGYLDLLHSRVEEHIQRQLMTAAYHIRRMEHKEALEWIQLILKNEKKNEDVQYFLKKAEHYLECQMGLKMDNG